MMEAKSLSFRVRKSYHLFAILLLISCDFPSPKLATEEQKRVAMQKAVFDHAIISDIGRYKDLKSFLVTYADTIISYRNSRNYVTVVSGPDSKTETVLHKEECYTFYQGDSLHDITNVPDFIKSKRDSICRAFGGSHIPSFEVCNDKKIKILVKSEGGENGLYISHNLMWNTKMEQDYAYIVNKDTLINGDCIYRIGMTEYHGH